MRESSHKQTFESWGDFLSYLSKYNSDGSSHDRPNDSWYGCSWDKTLELAVNGWEEGLEKVTKFTDSLYDKLSNSLKIDDYYYDVVGQDFDLDRVLIGEPECWLQSEQVEVKAPAQHNVKIQVNLICSGGIEPQVLIQRGAAIAALVMLLEKARRRVELEVVVINGWLNGFWSDVRIPIKQASDDLDMAKVVFALAHPATFRRLYFGYLEMQEERTRKQLNAYRNMGYGHCIDLPIEARTCDIYTPMAMYGESQWNNEKLAEEWILARLQEQGVELKKGE